MPEQSVENESGMPCFALGYGTPHNLEAVQDSALMITTSWPAKTKDKRHARYLP